MIYNLFKGLPTLQPPRQADPGFPPKKKSRFKSRRQVCVCTFSQICQGSLTEMPTSGDLKSGDPLFFVLSPPRPPSARYQQTPSLPPFTDKHKLTQSPNCNMQNVLDIRIMKSYMKHIPSKFAFIITKLLSNSENYG